MRKSENTKLLDTIEAITKVYQVLSPTDKHGDSAKLCIGAITAHIQSAKAEELAREASVTVKKAEGQ